MTSEPAGNAGSAPPGVDVETPNAARIYDWYLGGMSNFRADRELGRRVLEVFPDAGTLARSARRWLRTAVRALVEEHGVDQFLDLGSGIPGPGATHEVAQALNPDARVVYVDNEPVAVAHTQRSLRGTRGIEAISADFTRPWNVLGHPATRRLLDLDRPVAVIFSCSLHLIPDIADPAGIVATYRDATAPGSFLAISHGTSDNRPDFAAVSELYRDNASNQFVTRPHAEIVGWFSGYELVEPGLVFTALWRPEEDVDLEAAQRSGCYAGVGRKP